MASGTTSKTDEVGASWCKVGTCGCVGATKGLGIIGRGWWANDCCKSTLNCVWIANVKSGERCFQSANLSVKALEGGPIIAIIDGFYDECDVCENLIGVRGVVMG